MILNLKKIFNAIFSTSELRVQWYLSLLLYSKKRGFLAFSLIITRQLQRNYGVFISYHTTFDKTLFLCHPIGIVIGEGVKIGKNVKIYQNVTLGRASVEKSEYPIIGDNTIIYSGCVVLGGVKIGENCILGANSVVTKDVPSGYVAVGVPAKSYPRKEQ